MTADIRSFFNAARLKPSVARLEAATRAIQNALQTAAAAVASHAPAPSPAAFADAPWARSPAGFPESLRAAFPAAFTAMPNGQPGFGARAPHAGNADAANFITASHSAAGLQRNYKLFTPPAHFEGKRPLVVMLHGCTQNPDDFAAGTAINALAEKEGFFVLYPWQSDQANPQRCWNWFKHNHQARGRGEPALITDMTRSVTARYEIDADRVYIAGLSAGGAMAAICADAYPDVFAAAAVHSGLGAGAATDLPSALAAMRSGPPARHVGGSAAGVPTIVFHGDADAIVHPSNGDAVFERSAGPTGDVEVERLNKGGLPCTRRFVRAADGKIVAEHWRIHGTAHAWAGGSTAGSYTDARGPSATAEMLRFFQSHTRLPAVPGAGSR